eukprot:3378607-Amphidinium_carterae.1
MWGSEQGDPGLLPRCVQHLEHCCIQQSAAVSGTSYHFKCSVLRSRMSRAEDMLLNSDDHDVAPPRLVVRAPTDDNHMLVDNLTESYAGSWSEVEALFLEARTRASPENLGAPAALSPSQQNLKFRT